jgi:hypothetical protein
MDEALVRQLIADHFAAAGKDEVAAAEIFSEDAVVEWPQSGERTSVAAAALGLLVLGFVALWSIGALLLIAGVLAVLALIRDRDVTP